MYVQKIINFKILSYSDFKALRSFVDTWYVYVEVVQQAVGCYVEVVQLVLCGGCAVGTMWRLCSRYYVEVVQ